MITEGDISRAPDGVFTLSELVHLDFGTNLGGPLSVYLQGQLHANESMSMPVLLRLAEMLRESPPTRRIRIVPNANPIGWKRYLESGVGRYALDGQDWNRIFQDPGDPPITLNDQLANRLWRLSRECDVIIDVHTPEYGWPHVYTASPDTRLQTFDDLPYVMYGDPGVGPFDECHLRLRAKSQRPLLAVTLELPSHTLPTQDCIDYWAGRLRDELLSQDDFDGLNQPFSGIRGRMVDLVPSRDGVGILQCTPAETLTTGSPVLTVIDRGGNRETLTAPAECLPVCFRRATVVKGGYWAVRVIVLD